MKLPNLIKQARHAATSWLECDDALLQVNESFGQCFEAGRDNLNSQLMVAESSGFEMDQLQGPESAFRFPDLGALVMVKIHRLPVPCSGLEILDTRIEKMEKELKLLKIKRKAMIEKLKLKNHDFVTSKITTAYKRIIK